MQSLETIFMAMKECDLREKILHTLIPNSELTVGDCLTRLCSIEILGQESPLTIHGRERYNELLHLLRQIGIQVNESASRSLDTPLLGKVVVPSRLVVANGALFGYRALLQDFIF